jgi:hypothetical protein
MPSPLKKRKYSTKTLILKKTKNKVRYIVLQRYYIEWKNLGRVVKDNGFVISVNSKFMLFKIDHLHAEIVIPIHCIINSKKL